jgi:hypothetical protein
VEPPKAGLSFDINQQLQAGFDRGPLGLEPRGFQCPLDEAIINHDIGSHRILPPSSCVYLTELYTSLPIFRNSETSAFADETPDQRKGLIAHEDIGLRGLAPFRPGPVPVLAAERTGYVSVLELAAAAEERREKV